MISFDSLVASTIKTIMFSRCFLHSNKQTIDHSPFNIFNVSNVAINDCRFHSLAVVESVFDIELNSSTVRIIKSTIEEITKLFLAM